MECRIYVSAALFICLFLSSPFATVRPSNAQEAEKADIGVTAKRVEAMLHHDA